MLDSYEASVKHPSGLNRRFTYFCTHNFFARGGRELQDSERNCFKLCKDQFDDEFLRYVLFIFTFFLIYLAFLSLKI